MNKKKLIMVILTSIVLLPFCFNAAGMQTINPEKYYDGTINTPMEPILVPFGPFAKVYIDDDWVNCHYGQKVGNGIYYGINAFADIQSGIGAAKIDADIFVAEGVYYENVFVDKPVNLIGNDKNSTIIDADGIDDVVSVFIDDVSITGFSIFDSGPDEYDAGVKIWEVNSVTVDDCIIRDCDIGISFFKANDNVITNNMIYNCNMGIHVYFVSQNNLIDGNHITLNEYGLLLIMLSNENLVTNNIIDYNGDGIRIDHQTFDNNLYYNEFLYNTNNAWDAGSNIWDDQINKGNIWSDYTGGGIYIIPPGGNQDNYASGPC